MQKMTIVDEKFYGRLKSRSLTKRQSELFDTLFPKLEIKTFTDIEQALPNYDKVLLEIGFGSGEHLAQMARSHPADLFIGCEPFVNGVASLLIKIDEEKIQNIRVYQRDARFLIKELPNNFLDGVFLLFPDPWPKRKHIKRRFLQDKTITDIYTRLKPGAYRRVASDHKEYRNWILKMFGQDKFRGLFTAELFDRRTRPSEETWAKTRYERKAEDEILYAIYTKVIDGE